MAGEGMLEQVPSEAISSGTDAGAPGKLSFLTASWINERVLNVTARVEEYLNRIIDDGLLADGFMPFQSPITDDMLARMGPEQFRAYFDTIPSLTDKAALLERMKALKLPLPILLPFPDRPYPDPRPSASLLAQQPPSSVSSSGIV